MAISLGTVTGVWSYSQPSGPHAKHTLGGHERTIECCFVSVNHNDQANAYAQADGFTFNPVVAIQNSRRDGKTITVYGAVCVESGNDNGVLSSAGSTAALPTSVTANVVHGHVVIEDLATEKGNGAWAAAATWTKDCVYCVTYGVQED